MKSDGFPMGFEKRGRGVGKLTKSYIVYTRIAWGLKREDVELGRVTIPVTQVVWALYYC